MTERGGDWVTVLVTHDEIDAELKVGLLQNAGIECVMESAPASAKIMPFGNTIRINVQKEDLETARGVLSGIP